MSVLPLRIEGAAVRRGGARLIGPVDLVLGGSGVTAVIGPNGSGKTTLLRLMHGLARPAEGRADWALPEAEARRARAFVFQRPVMLRRTVAANLAFPLRLARRPAAETRARVAAAAARFDLGALMDQRAATLSGGEAQRLALARALIGRPDVLIADEPTASLDGRATAQVEGHLAKEAARGTRLILATHDMGQARRLASEVVFLLHGRVHEAGPAAGFFAAPRTPQAAAFLRGDIVE